MLGPTSNNLERNVSLVIREGWHWTETKIKMLNHTMYEYKDHSLYCIGIFEYAYHKRLTQTLHIKCIKKFESRDIHRDIFIHDNSQLT